MAIKQIKNKEVNIRVKDNDIFYANEISVNVNPTEVILDFKCLSQLQDIANHSALIVKHCPIIITPYSAKNLNELLTKAIKDYEKKFCKIEKSKAIKKAEKIIDKQKKEKKEKIDVIKPETYFG